MKRQKQPDYRGLRQAINEARWAKSKGKKVKWAALKKTLAIAWQFGYIRYPMGLGVVKANTVEGHTVLMELADQFCQAKLVVKSTLNRDRGWTDGLIKKYDLKPDIYAENPHYARAEPMQLFSLYRVMRIECDDDVAADLAKVLERRPARRQAALRAANTRVERNRQAEEEKYQSFLLFLNGLDFVVPCWPVAELVKYAMRRYSYFRHENSDRKGGDPTFLEQVCCTHLRHDCTNYDTLIGLYQGMRETEAIRQKVDEAISVAYPNLLAEIIASP
ncbi:MAG: hypothetical protein WA885_13945 [Phormidesmis sp.]